MARPAVQGRLGVACVAAGSPGCVRMHARMHAQVHDHRCVIRRVPGGARVVRLVARAWRVARRPHLASGRATIADRGAARVPAARAGGGARPARAAAPMGARAMPRDVGGAGRCAGHPLRWSASAPLPGAVKSARRGDVRGRMRCCRASARPVAGRGVGTGGPGHRAAAAGPATGRSRRGRRGCCLDRAWVQRGSGARARAPALVGSGVGAWGRTRTARACEGAAR